MVTQEVDRSNLEALPTPERTTQEELNPEELESLTGGSVVGGGGGGFTNPNHNQSVVD